MIKNIKDRISTFVRRATNVILESIRTIFCLISHAIFFTKSNEKIQPTRTVTAFFTWMAFIVCGAMFYTQAGFTEAPLWLDIIASILGITASIRIAEGVILTPNKIKQISSEVEPRKAISLIMELLKDASHYCLQGVLILIYAFLLQLMKVYITEHQNELKHKLQQEEGKHQQECKCNPSR